MLKQYKKICALTICISILVLSFLSIGFLAIHEHHDCASHSNESHCEICILITTSINMYKKLVLVIMSKFIILPLILVFVFLKLVNNHIIYILSPIKLKVKMLN